ATQPARYGGRRRPPGAAAPALKGEPGATQPARYGGRRRPPGAAAPALKGEPGATQPARYGGRRRPPGAAAPAPGGNVSRYLLETDALIDFSKGREPATSRILQLIEQGDELGVCAVNVAEFFAGLPPSDRPYWQRVFSTLAYWEVSIAAAWHAGEWRYDFARRGRALP